MYYSTNREHSVSCVQASHSRTASFCSLPNFLYENQSDSNSEDRFRYSDGVWSQWYRRSCSTRLLGGLWHCGSWHLTLQAHRVVQCGWYSSIVAHIVSTRKITVRSIWSGYSTVSHSDRSSDLCSSSSIQLNSARWSLLIICLSAYCQTNKV